MVTAVLNGGLGNQLFQIATAYALAKDNRDECAFNFDNIVPNQGRPACCYKRDLYSKLSKLPPEWSPDNIHKEPRFNYSEIEYKKNLRLEGYFQSEKYFGAYQRDLLDLFLDNSAQRVTIKELLGRYYFDLRGESVSMHVRRGDYIKFKDIHTNLGKDYYNEALQYIKDRVNVRYVLVFSDDVEWCMGHFSGIDHRYIYGLEDYEDLLLMSLCQHNIIANSSFSWWGAYLNQNKNKIVCAPKQWFGGAFGDEWDDIYTKNMVVI